MLWQRVFLRQLILIVELQLRFIVHFGSDCIRLKLSFITLHRKYWVVQEVIEILKINSL